MAEVSCGSQRSEWVMAWVTEIGDRRSEWVFGCDRCFWLWFLVVFGVGQVFLVVVFGCCLWFLCLKVLWVVGRGWVRGLGLGWVVGGLWVRCLGRG